ncbi:hypothetical protein R1flu_023490 [Riccia fluitans]|uniref:Uncharacterized protein n=1 Tax=Riccia fluitans TaxID=41844 RepID=A0ABD1XS68_9MARC
MCDIKGKSDHQFHSYKVTDLTEKRILKCGLTSNYNYSVDSSLSAVHHICLFDLSIDTKIFESRRGRDLPLL